MHTAVHMWGSEGNLQELALTFHHVGPGNEIWVGRGWQSALLPREASCHPDPEILRTAVNICRVPSRQRKPSPRSVLWVLSLGFPTPPL